MNKIKKHRLERSGVFDIADGFSLSRNRSSDAEAVVAYSESRRRAIKIKSAVSRTLYFGYA
jgi:hypothetical protein